MKEHLMQMRPLFGKEEAEAVSAYMQSDVFITEFRQTEEFEKRIAEFTGAKYCVATNNGTISLSLAGMSIGLKAGDEVIVPNYTMVATPNSLKLLGVEPVFVDVERDSLCLDLELVRAAITEKTKAIMLVSANGRYPTYEVSQLFDLAREREIPIIEDAAQSLGSYYPNGKHIGRMGVIGSFSFSAPKIISTGQGGCVITDDYELYEKIRKLKDFGRESGGTDTHDSIGFNFKFTDLQAVVGIEQMKKLATRVARKKEIWHRYSQKLAEIDRIKLFDHDTTFTAPWFIDSLAQDRDGLIEFLKHKNIGTRVMYPPINGQKAYSKPGSYPVSELVGRNGLWLPSMVQLTDDQIDYVCSSINEYYS